MSVRPRVPLTAGFPPPPPPGVPGDPGVTPAEGPMWAATSQRAILLGGTAAVLLQVAHPSVAAGVAQHSSYAHDPAARLLGTMDAVLTITFGDTEQARAIARAVGGKHARVRGTTGDGTPYRAQDPELARWVHATLVGVGADLAERWLGLDVDQAFRERYWREWAPFGRLFGVRERDLDLDWAGFDAYYRATLDTLEVGPAARGIAADLLGIRTTPPIPAGPLQRTLVADLVPPRLAAAYGCSPTPTRRTAAALLRTGTRVALPLLPAGLRNFAHLARARSRMLAGTTPTANAPTGTPQVRRRLEPVTGARTRLVRRGDGR